MHIFKSIKGFYRKIFSNNRGYTKSGNIYVISDTHLGHANILTYCKRPFKNVEVMNQELARRWNRKVNKHDVVYFLGDFVFRGNTRILEIAPKWRKNIYPGQSRRQIEGGNP